VLSFGYALRALHAALEAQLLVLSARGWSPNATLVARRRVCDRDAQGPGSVQRGRARRLVLAELPPLALFLGELGRVPRPASMTFPSSLSSC
jgi:hypothetical protein